MDLATFVLPKLIFSGDSTFCSLSESMQRCTTLIVWFYLSDQNWAEIAGLWASITRTMLIQCFPKPAKTETQPRLCMRDVLESPCFLRKRKAHAAQHAQRTPAHRTLNRMFVQLLRENQQKIIMCHLTFKMDAPLQNHIPQIKVEETPAHAQSLFKHHRRKSSSGLSDMKTLHPLACIIRQGRIFRKLGRREQIFKRVYRSECQPVKLSVLVTRTTQRVSVRIIVFDIDLLCSGYDNKSFHDTLTSSCHVGSWVYL